MQNHDISKVTSLKTFQMSACSPVDPYTLWDLERFQKQIFICLQIEVFYAKKMELYSDLPDNGRFKDTKKIWENKFSNCFWKTRFHAKLSCWVPTAFKHSPIQSREEGGVVVIISWHLTETHKLAPSSVSISIWRHWSPVLEYQRSQLYSYANALIWDL